MRGRETLLIPEKALVTCIEPEDGSVDAAAWAAANRLRLEERVLETGAVLLRGFPIADAAAFEAVVRAVSPQLLDYEHGSSPRKRVLSKVYTSTEYPANQEIPLHNELCYTSAWPWRIWFYSHLVASARGETPLADSQRIYMAMPAELRKKFEQKKVAYIRNYTGLFDLSWQSAFQTESREQVEALCRRRGISFEWVTAEHLRTREICQGITRHPITRAMVWFNQAHLFHISNLPVETREAFLETMPVEDLPRNATYGDGTPFTEEELQQVRAVLQQEKFQFPWQKGDILYVDNMRLAHGRNTFEGPRKVLVAMTDLMNSVEAAE